MAILKRCALRWQPSYASIPKRATKEYQYLMKVHKWFTTMLVATSGLCFLNRWGKRWGATPAEYRQSLPGDELVPHPDLETNHAITIQAPPEKIWPWLVQMGYYRGGWNTDSTWRDWDYYPDRMMRFLVREDAEKSGIGHRDTPTDARVVPELQNLKAGDIILDGPPGTAFFTVAAIEPNRHLILHSNTHLRYLFPKSIRENPTIGVGGEFTWAFYLQRAGENQSRLILRTRGRVEPGWYRSLINAAIPIADLFMARKMLRGIRQKVEQS